MKIAFVGKGGSGKSTLSSLFARYLAQQPDIDTVVGLDTDFNQHFSLLLGAPEVFEQNAKMLGDATNMQKLKDIFRGSNPRLANAGRMIKTTPPGTGSNLYRLNDSHPVLQDFAHEIGGIKLLLTGGMQAEGIGVNCFHAYNGWAELFLAHTIDATNEYIVCDATAGTDPLSSGLFTRFDVTFLVVEPTVQGVSVYRQYATHAREYGVKLYVLGNKVEDEADEVFLQERIGRDLLACIPVSPFVRAMKRGQQLPFSELEQLMLSVFAAMRHTIEQHSRDWRVYQATVERLHRKNARAWAGGDALTQIDPGFDLQYVADQLLAS